MKEACAQINCNQYCPKYLRIIDWPPSFQCLLDGESETTRPIYRVGEIPEARKQKPVSNENKEKKD